MTGAARAGIALAAACYLLGATSSALARSKKHRREHKSHHQSSHADVARGKRHLKKANALAGEAKCAAAIAEYTLAYELLNDPVVLFNRAECYRRVEENEKAADDYRAFLDKVPGAPNRLAIEKKLLALEAPEPSQREKPAETPPPTKPPPAKVVEAPPPPAKAPPPPAKVVEPPLPPAKAPPLPAKVVEAPAPPAKAPPPPAKVAETAPPPPPPLAPPPAPAPTSESKPVAAVVVQQPATRDDATPASGSRPWVWVALSVLAVGAGVGGYFMFRPHDQTPPETALGNYRF